MSSLIYANKHCEMTSFTPPPMADLPGDPVALEELLGSLEGNFLKSPAWVISGHGRASSVCPPALQESKRLPESGAWGGEGGDYKQKPHCFFPFTWDQSVINTATLRPTNLPPPGNACLNQCP